MSDFTSAKSAEQYLGHQIRIIIDDGRIIEGEFRCMDKDLNFILGSAVEYHGLKDCTMQPEHADFKAVTTRSLGSAMVPGMHIVKILADVSAK